MATSWTDGVLERLRSPVLDAVAGMPGVKGLMLTFDDFLLGMDAFGARIQPLMRCRAERRLVA